MLLETLIGLVVLIYLLWKYLLPSKCEQVQYDKLENIQSTLSETQSDDISNKDCNENKYETFDTKHEIPEIPKVESKHENKYVKTEELITPSILLKQRNEKLLDENPVRRESPPKEKLAEFLEKTILSDDKIQSIIQNLSLDKSEILIHEEPKKFYTPLLKILCPS
ncbi:hypothetical protein HF086_017627 [Spodoptera exigua]|uniref:Uncharacterized protein n=1 Tax=Spodoptera exigua TaxID=7107 RepID=A0A922MF02_SPOEX|nr:hypothetical protein HF086_017627 [Spodoptera exigua]